MEEVGVDGVGGDDGGGAEVFDEGGEVALGAGHEGHVRAGEVAFVGVFVDFFPDFGEMGGDEAVAPLEEGGGVGGGAEAGVCDEGVCSGGIKGEGEVFRGGVMPFAEGGGDDEDAWWWGHRRRSGGEFRR